MVPDDASWRGRSEAGLVTLWSLAWLFVCLTVAWVGLALGVGVAEQHHLDGSADLVALSAAKELESGGNACASASAVAKANRVELYGCRVVGADVVISVRTVVDLAFGLRPRITAEARAGPQ
jgi:secretion/DNA translocation related TadE-like protein